VTFHGGRGRHPCRGRLEAADFAAIEGTFKGGSLGSAKTARPVGDGDSEEAEAGERRLWFPGLKAWPPAMRQGATVV
jgi:hypothetical protein